MSFVTGSDSCTAEVQQVSAGNPEALFLVAGFSDGNEIMAEVIDSGDEGTILVCPEVGGRDCLVPAAGFAGDNDMPGLRAYRSGVGAGDDGTGGSAAFVM